MIFGSLLLILTAVALLIAGLARGSNGLVIGSIAASLLAAIALIVLARRPAEGTSADDAQSDADAVGADSGGADAGGAGTRGTRAYAGAATDAGDAMRPEGTGRDPRRRNGPGDSLTDTQPHLIVPDAELVGAAHRGGPGTVYGGDPATAHSADEIHPGVIPAQSRAGDGSLDRDATALDRGTAGRDQAVHDRTVSAGQPDMSIDDLDDDLDDEEPLDEPAPAPISPADAARVARLSIEVQVIDGRPRYHLAGCVHLLGRDGEPLPVSEAIELGFTPCSLCEPDSSLLAEARRV